MWKMETRTLHVYYPRNERALALRVASRVEDCVSKLRAHTVSKEERDKPIIILTSANFNNAFVVPPAFGLREEMVLPTHFSVEAFNFFDIGTSAIDEVACHEALHYIHFQQISGLWLILSWIAGDVFSPNSMLDLWFIEGLATYYEARFDEGFGRPHSPFFRGLFESGATALQGRLDPGFLSMSNREELLTGGHYLSGSIFVDYLARTYGEQKLWELIDLQGDSILSPFGVTLRFKWVYGKSIGALMDDFDDELRATLEPRVRPSTQEVIMADVGYVARIATAPNEGSIALFHAGLDEVPRITILDRDGSTRVSRALTSILPPRPIILARPEIASGLSFSHDGRHLYFVVADESSDTSFDERLLELDTRDGSITRVFDHLGGIGGAISADDRTYIYAASDGSAPSLMALDLESDARRSLGRFEGAKLIGGIAVSDGGRIAFSMRDETGLDLFVREPDGATRRVTRGGRMNYGAEWLDEERLVFSGVESGRLQAQTVDVETGAIATNTDAPFIVVDPRPLPGGRIAFLNRDGWGWSLDTAPLAQSTVVSSTVASSTVASSSIAAVRPAEVLSDESYSSFDHLLIPNLRIPIAAYSPFSGEGFVILQLSGSDRLGLHHYLQALSYNSSTKGLLASAVYANYQLAPWIISASASLQMQPMATNTALNSPNPHRENDVSGSLLASRTYFTTPVQLGFNFYDRRVEGIEHLRLFGPTAGLSYLAIETTPYGGVHRGFGATLAATLYPKAFAATYRITDLAGTLTGYVPLPLLKRHELRLQLRGRMLIGAPAGLLQIGGIIPGQTANLSGGTYNSNTVAVEVPSPLFAEPLRGFEDHIFTATALAVAQAEYRYGFIIDHGWASLLYLLPSFFVSQLDAEVFGVAAKTDAPGSGVLRAIGAAAVLRASLRDVPLALSYQVTHRFDDALGTFHFVSLGL
jgi:hypothetical protein